VVGLEVALVVGGMVALVVVLEVIVLHRVERVYNLILKVVDLELMVVKVMIVVIVLHLGVVVVGRPNLDSTV
jgi:hypothetical protein